MKLDLWLILRHHILATYLKYLDLLNQTVSNFHNFGVLGFWGGSLGQGLKSLAVTVRMQPKEATLKDAEIESVATKIVEKVAKATGGTLRN